MARVSVVIPTYNCASFLGRAIDSALAQTYKDYEIIVVDDGSTDHTAEVVATYGTKLLYYYQPNRGLSSARNYTLSKAGGEFIAYLDADDMWSPKKLERQVEFLDAHPECGLVHTDVSVINEDDNILHARFNAETARSIPQGYCLSDLLRRCHIQILSVLERRSCADKVGEFESQLLVAQDYYHWIRAAMEGFAIGYIDEALALYRWRKGSLLSSQTRLLEDLIKICQLLLNDTTLELRHGSWATAIVQDQLYTYERDLAYLDRAEGRAQVARHRIKRLIQKWPMRAELYADLLKSYLLTRTAPLSKTQEPNLV
jgi:glycosyltransferase involved in cell wall biosynthesis